MKYIEIIGQQLVCIFCLAIKTRIAPNADRQLLCTANTIASEIIDVGERTGSIFLRLHAPKFILREILKLCPWATPFSVGVGVKICELTRNSPKY